MNYEHDAMTKKRKQQQVNVELILTPKRTNSCSIATGVVEMNKVILKATQLYQERSFLDDYFHHPQDQGDSSDSDTTPTADPSPLQKVTTKKIQSSDDTARGTVGTENLKLKNNPYLTFLYFTLEIRKCCNYLLDQLKAYYTTTASRLTTEYYPCGIICTSLLLFFIGSTATLMHYAGDENGDSSIIQEWIEATKEALFWIGCGFLSTAGLGSGVQTGALFLFPHVCTVAIEWVQNQTSGPTESSLSWTALLWTVGWPGFWSGTGSAVGELVPYILARCIRAAGGDPFAILSDINGAEDDTSSGDHNDGDDYAKSDGNPQKRSKSVSSILLANTRAAMERQMANAAKSSNLSKFMKIFVLATIPNALFDLCGLVCGAAPNGTVPFWVFFGGTWVGKAFIRTPLQTCGLATAIAVTLLADDADHEWDEGVDKWSGGVGRTVFHTVRQWAQRAVSKFTDGDANNDVPSSSVPMEMLKISWKIISICLFGFFIVSTIEQIAQHHARTLRNQNRF